MRFLRDLSYSPLAYGYRAAKSRARGASPAAQPSSSHLGCGARAHPLRTTRISNRRRSVSGLLDPSALLIAMALDIVRVGHASLAARGLVPRFQLQIAQLPRVQRRPGPHVAFAFAQQMPDGAPRAYGRSRKRRHADRRGRGLAGRTHATDPALALPPKPPRRACRAHAHGPFL